MQGERGLSGHEAGTDGGRRGVARAVVGGRRRGYCTALGPVRREGTLPIARGARPVARGRASACPFGCSFGPPPLRRGAAGYRRGLRGLSSPLSADRPERLRPLLRCGAGYRLV